MVPLALAALSLAAADLTPPPPPPDVEPQAQEPQRQAPARTAPRFFLYTAPLQLLLLNLNAELEVQVNDDAAVFAGGGANFVGWNWQAGARWYLPPLQNAGPWRGFLDGHVSQFHIAVTGQGDGIGFGGTAGVRILTPVGLAASLGAGADVVTLPTGPTLAPQLRVSIGWGF